MSSELALALQRCLMGGKSGAGLQPCLCNVFFACTLLRFQFVMFNSNSFLVSGAGINLSSLLIKEGKVCWDLYIDGLVISSDGNLLDALGAAIKVILVMCLVFSLDP